MKTLSFLGETPTQALQNALKECGDDGIVISTKKISDKRTNGKDMYEILIALEEDKDEDQFRHKVQVKPTTNDKIDLSPQFYDFRAEILQMQEEIKKVQKTLWEPKSKLYDLVVPSEFIDIYKLFEKNDFDEEMTYTILKKTITQLPLSMKSNEQKINDFFKLILRRMIPIKFEVPMRVHQRKVMMFVGPTGVGKTTTIAKLAARYAYKMGMEYKVGIITLDSFRVGAIEQLKAYANIMRLPLEIVKKSEDLVEAILRLQDCHYILIDTAGSSQYDIEKIESINEYQNRLQEIEIEKILVLPANVKKNDLFEIYDQYSILGINNILFTKLDETRSFGNIISFAYKIKKSISYLSIGQNVPDDLITAEDTYLIDCFMEQKIPKKLKK
ncbi:MAG: flagellar biosynthesis protein FlhF [Arcobacteraceae bacterium]|jgi:flagellar biosynthesis protein FlhF|nr:flagellar biosynthesis protein FlhF [Arcobacteraceae bacterium]